MDNLINREPKKQATALAREICEKITTDWKVWLSPDKKFIFISKDSLTESELNSNLPVFEALVNQLSPEFDVVGQKSRAKEFRFSVREKPPEPFTKRT